MASAAATTDAIAIGTAALVGSAFTSLPHHYEWAELSLGMPAILVTFLFMMIKFGFTDEDRALADAIAREELQSLRIPDVEVSSAGIHAWAGAPASDGALLVDQDDRVFYKVTSAGGALSRLVTSPGLPRKDTANSRPEETSQGPCPAVDPARTTERAPGTGRVADA